MKRALRQVFCVALCAVMLMLCVPSALAADGDYSFNYAASTYTWNINLLNQPSNIYNKNIAMCCSALTRYLKDQPLFTQAGFTSFTSSSYSLPNTHDGIYYTFAGRNIGDTSYIIVSIAGTIGDQWYGNVNVGTDSEHQSFVKARDTILADLENNFLSACNAGSKLKIVVTGHSRGASTANLVAAKLNKIGTLGGRAVTKDGVFAYTFAAANTTTASDAHSADYDNIFNFANRDDFVTAIPPAQMGYTVYGKILVLPSITFNSDYMTLFNAMQTSYKYSNSSEFSLIDTGAVGPMTIADTMSTLSDYSANGYYSNKYTVDGNDYSCYDFMVKYADYRSSNKALNSAATSFFTSARSSVFAPVVNFAVESGSKLWATHMPPVYAAWVSSLSQEDLFSAKTFNKVTVNTDAKIKVYDKNNKLVGIVKNGSINEYMTNPVTIRSTNDGYVLYLPGDADYTVTLVGTSDSNYTYKVEGCADTGVAAKTVTAGGSISAGEILNATVFNTSSTNQSSAYAFTKADSTPQDDPTAPVTPPKTQTFWQKLQAFFAKILNWFKAIFS